MFLFVRLIGTSPVLFSVAEYLTAFSEVPRVGSSEVPQQPVNRVKPQPVAPYKRRSSVPELELGK